MESRLSDMDFGGMASAHFDNLDASVGIIQGSEPRVASGA